MKIFRGPTKELFADHSGLSEFLGPVVDFSSIEREGAKEKGFFSLVCEVLPQSKKRKRKRGMPFGAITSLVEHYDTLSEHFFRKMNFPFGRFVPAE